MVQSREEHNKKSLQYYKDHREERIAYNKQYYKDHREEDKKRYEGRKAYFKQYRKDNSEKRKQYRKDNPEVDLRTMKKQLTNLGKILDMDYDSFKYGLISFTRTVRKRDGNKCTWCNSTEKLVAHHIWHKAFCPESALDVDNGITLCHDCHKEQHRLDRSLS